MPALKRCLDRLKGRYGFRRFTRDGYATVLDTNNEYQPGELMVCLLILLTLCLFHSYLMRKMKMS
ncbi:unnamed protein product [Trichobilharzia regenti]|nr:unnamed protein product [Trichobilharzia regenti]